MRFMGSSTSKIRLRPGLRRGPRWGSLQHSPRPPSWWGGASPRTPPRSRPFGPQSSALQVRASSLAPKPKNRPWEVGNLPDPSQYGCYGPVPVFPRTRGSFLIVAISRCNGIWETTRHNRDAQRTYARANLLQTCCRFVVYVADLLQGSCQVVRYLVLLSRPRD